jgi:uncharacterized protein (TIGR02271 family)
MGTHTLDDIKTWRDATVLGSDGEKIGSVHDVYLDRQSGEPAWIAINTGLFGSRVSFAPVEGASRHEDHLHLAFTKDQVKDAPNVEADGELSPAEEQALYTHYGRDWGQWDDATPDRTADLLGDEDRFSRDAVGQDTSGTNTDDAMTRSEEELTVGTARQEAGRARLRKFVTTEQVSQTVPVEREQVRVEREPITDANVGQALDGPAISEEEHEVVLHEEVPVVQKTAVPKERVRLEKETVVEQETVTDEVRKEHIEVEGDASDRV